MAPLHSGGEENKAKDLDKACNWQDAAAVSNDVKFS